MLFPGDLFSWSSNLDLPTKLNMGQGTKTEGVITIVPNKLGQDQLGPRPNNVSFG